MEKVTLTAQETADYIGVSYMTVTRMVKRKEIGCIRVGKKILFRKETLDQWMTDQEKKGSAGEPEEAENVINYVRRRESC